MKNVEQTTKVMNELKSLSETIASMKRTLDKIKSWLKYQDRTKPVPIYNADYLKWNIRNEETGANSETQCPALSICLNEYLVQHWDEFENFALKQANIELVAKTKKVKSEMLIALGMTDDPEDVPEVN